MHVGLGVQVPKDAGGPVLAMVAPSASSRWARTGAESTLKQRCPPVYHTYTHTHTHTGTRTHTHTHAHAHTHTGTHTHARTHIRTHACACAGAGSALQPRHAPIRLDAHLGQLAPFRSPVGNEMMATRRLQQESSNVLGSKVRGGGGAGARGGWGSGGARIAWCSGAAWSVL